MEDTHTMYLQMAIQEASLASEQKTGHPFGCIIIQGDQIICQTHNQIFQQNDVTAHCEMIAIRKAQQILNQKTFENCILYCSSEPCLMCQGAIYIANFKCVYYSMSLQELKHYLPQNFITQYEIQADLQNTNKGTRKIPFYQQLQGIQQLGPLFDGLENTWPDLQQNNQVQEEDAYEQYENYDNYDNLQETEREVQLLQYNQQQQMLMIQQFPKSPKQEQYDQMLKIGTTQVTLKRTSKIDLKLFVGQIPKNWVEQDVTNFFSDSGEILESQIIRDTKNGYHKGCAFVKFSSMTEAEAVIDQLQGKLLEGMTAPLQIKWADGESERLGVSPGKIPKLFVGSLPKECTDENLRDIFEPFGAIDELHLNKDPDGRSKGTAIIKYEKTESALLAIRNLNAQAYLQNSDRPLEVKFAERKSVYEQQQQQQIGQQAKVTNPLSTWVVYYTTDNIPYYYNCLTQNCQYEKPPAGSIQKSCKKAFEIGKFFEKQIIVYNQDLSSSYIEAVPVTSLNDMAENGVKRPGPAGANLFIFHLPSDFRDSDLYNLFKPHGNVISARVITQDGKSKGYGFVSYDSADGGKEAINKMNGYQVTNGKRLLVKVKDGEEVSQKYQTPNLTESRFNPN